jgi:hypothetical protein
MRRRWLATIGGYGWKSLSLGCRAAFVLKVLPDLPVGQLTSYVFWTTLALLIARTLTIGFEEELPLIVRGHPIRSHRFFLLYLIPFAAAQLLLVIELLFSFDAIAVAFLVATYVSYVILGGLVRSISARAFEVLTNVQWPIFLAILLITGSSSAMSLVTNMGISLVVAQVVTLITCAQVVSHSPRLDRRSLLVLWYRLPHAAPKLVSQLVSLSFVRGPVLWPKLFNLAAPSDAIAFAITLGEAAWQIGMVVVNRWFTKYSQMAKRAASLWEHTRKSLVVTVSCFVFPSLLLLVLPLPAWVPVVVDKQYVIPGLLFFGVWTCYLQLRYMGWALQLRPWQFIGREVFVVAVLIPVTAFMPMWTWLPSLALLGLLLVAATIVAMLPTLQPRSHKDSARPPSLSSFD